VRPFATPGVQKSDENWLVVLTSSLAISFQYMHLVAAGLGLATRWVSAVKTPSIERKVNAILGIPKEFITHDMMALGTSDFVPSEKKMRALSEVIHYGICKKNEFRTDEGVKTYFTEVYFIGNSPIKP
jgi:nitroreductase